MIPQGGTLTNGEAVTIEQQPSRTYRMDLEKNQIIGMADGLDAIKQAVYKILETNRYEFPIYSSDYGSELMGISGDQSYIQSEFKRRIREALLQDDRVTDITDFDIQISNDSIVATFSVMTEFGDFQEEVTTSV